MSTLVLQDVDGRDASGWYQCIVSNAGVSVTSSVVSVTMLPTPPTNSFAALAIGYGAVGLVAFERARPMSPWVSIAAAVLLPRPTILSAVLWPGYYSMNGNVNGGNVALGFPGGGIQGARAVVGLHRLPRRQHRAGGDELPAIEAAVLERLFLVGTMTVTTAASPTIPANTTNVLVVAWVYPTAAIEPTNAGIVVMSGGSGSVAEVDGLCYSGAYSSNAVDIFLDYRWNATDNGNDSSVDPPLGTWSTPGWWQLQPTTRYIFATPTACTPMFRPLAMPIRAGATPSVLAAFLQVQARCQTSTGTSALWRCSPTPSAWIRSPFSSMPV